ARKAHLDADHAFATLLPASDAGGLDRVRFLERNRRAGGYLLSCTRVQGSRVERLGDLQDVHGRGFTCAGHVAASFSIRGARAKRPSASRARRRSRVTSTIMSSCPPTICRRPSSIRMSRTSIPYSFAAASACRRKLE